MASMFVHLAALAFMFAPAGASLSVDRILTKLNSRWSFGRESDPKNYYWALILAQFSVALFYFAAAWAKIYNGGIYWALGDNMRIMVGITWDHPYYFKEPTWLIELLLNDKLIWQGAAVIHLISQFLPMTAMFFIHRPLVRLLEGVIFLSGVYGLYHVMAVWNPLWVWLAAVFIDWDWVVARFRDLLGRLSSDAGMAADRLANDLRSWSSLPVLFPAPMVVTRQSLRRATFSLCTIALPWRGLWPSLAMACGSPPSRLAKST